MSFLAQRDLVTCMHVCSRLYSIASDSNLCEYLYTAEFSSTINNQALLPLTGKKVVLTKADLEQRHLVSLVHQCPYLESIQFRRCSLKKGSASVDLNLLFSKLPKLKVFV